MSHILSTTILAFSVQVVPDEISLVDQIEVNSTASTADTIGEVLAAGSHIFSFHENWIAQQSIFEARSSGGSIEWQVVLDRTQFEVVDLESSDDGLSAYFLILEFDASGEADNFQVWSYEADSGVRRWETSLPMDLSGSPYFPNGSLDFDGTTLAASVNRGSGFEVIQWTTEVSILNAQTGAFEVLPATGFQGGGIVGQAHDDPPICEYSEPAGLVCLWTEPGTISMRDVQAGTQIWFDGPEQVAPQAWEASREYNGACFSADGSQWIVARGDSVESRDARTGLLLWEQPFITAHDVIQLSTGDLFVAGTSFPWDPYAPRMRAAVMDSTTGTPRWEADFPPGVEIFRKEIPFRVIAEDVELGRLGCRNSDLYVLDRDTGQLLEEQKPFGGYSTGSIGLLDNGHWVAGSCSQFGSNGMEDDFIVEFAEGAQPLWSTNLIKEKVAVESEGVSFTRIPSSGQLQVATAFPQEVPYVIVPTGGYQVYDAQGGLLGEWEYGWPLSPFYATLKPSPNGRQVALVQDAGIDVILQLRGAQSGDISLEAMLGDGLTDAEGPNVWWSPNGEYFVVTWLTDETAQDSAIAAMFRSTGELLWQQAWIVSESSPSHPPEVLWLEPGGPFLLAQNVLEGGVMNLRMHKVDPDTGESLDQVTWVSPHPGEGSRILWSRQSSRPGRVDLALESEFGSGRAVTLLALDSWAFEIASESQVYEPNPHLAFTPSAFDCNVEGQLMIVGKRDFDFEDLDAKVIRLPDFEVVSELELAWPGSGGGAISLALLSPELAAVQGEGVGSGVDGLLCLYDLSTGVLLEASTEEIGYWEGFEPDIGAPMANGVLWTVGKPEYGHPSALHALQIGSLLSGPDELPVAGGALVFQLWMGEAVAGSTHLLLGSAMGTGPWTLSSGVDLPLSPDGYLTASLQLAGQGLFKGSVGTLDDFGRASIVFAVPELSPDLIGLSLYHAALALDAQLVPLATTSPVEVLLIP